MSYDADAAPTRSPDRHLARRILIVGGVAGGASCAARLRRLDELVESAIFDRWPYVAFANCGLPYHVGDVIADERVGRVARCSANGSISGCTPTPTSQHTAAGTVSVRDLRAATAARNATRWSCHRARRRSGHSAGVDLPGVFAVRNIPDSRRIRSWIADRRAGAAVVVGGGLSD
jgi:NADPH-dependent 2,4-dienoyl-CoA reductase/sulfur reductase-like enzyme